jgi:hypothetical protein
VEIKQRSLEELDVIFASGGNPVWKEKMMPHDLSVADSRRILGLDVDDSSSEEDFKMADIPWSRFSYFTIKFGIFGFLLAFYNIIQNILFRPSAGHVFTHPKRLLRTRSPAHFTPYITQPPHTFSYSAFYHGSPFYASYSPTIQAPH